MRTAAEIKADFEKLLEEARQSRLCETAVLYEIRSLFERGRDLAAEMEVLCASRSPPSHIVSQELASIAREVLNTLRQRAGLSVVGSA